MSKSTKTKFGLKAALSLSVGLTALAAGGSLTAMAQDEGADEDRRLNTVTITATKREQTLQDVPVAVSVVDDSVIEKAEILDLNDLQSLVPSLGFRTFQNSVNANFTIRGFGNGANNAGIEPSVGIFIDGVYRSRAAAQIGDLPNIQRVEVLRGPQSTLFGKNASAGVVSVITRKPEYDFGGNVEASFGNLNLRRTKGYLTGPITDNLAFSIGGGLNQRDGTATEVETGDKLNERERWNLRGELLFEPTENQEWRLIADVDEIDEVCCVATNLINGGATDAIVQALGGQLVAEDPFARNIALNRLPSNFVKNQGVSLHGDIEFDGFTFTTITAYRETLAKIDYDIDYTSGDLASLNDRLELETFTQEVRFTSNSDGAFDWMVGGFYFDETVSQQSQLSYDSSFRDFLNISAALGGATDPATVGAVTGAFTAGVLPDTVGGVEALLGLPGGIIGADGSGTTEDIGQEDTALSLFGTLDWHLSDRLTASIGLNYSENEKKASINAVSTDALAALDLVQTGYIATIGALIGATGINPGDPGYGTIQQQALAVASNLNPSTPAMTQNPLIALRAFQFQPPFLNIPNAVESGITDDDQITYSFRLAYDLTDNINVYGSYATGWKSSSVNLSRDSRPFATDFTPSLDPVTLQSVGTVVDPFTGDVLRTAPSSPIQDAGLAVNNLTTGTRFAEPEDSEVFEIGLKGSWDNFALNVAIFDQTIENFQSNVFLGTGFVLANAEEQSATGLEIDMSWSPVENLTLNFAGTFLDPSYDSFPNGSVIDGAGNNFPTDLSGTTPSGIPETITSASALYDFNVTDSWSGFARADWQYESDVDFFGALSPAEQIVGSQYTREVDLWNASLGFVSENGLGITFWGRNIFDQEYITTAFPGVAQPGIFSGYPSQPQTYGVTLRKTF